MSSSNDSNSDHEQFHSTTCTTTTTDDDDNNNNDITSPWRIGRTRIQDACLYTGTVVYIGPVASAQDPNEIYLGVVWDDFSRGKHDGSVIDRQTKRVVRHFKAPHPTSASFLRPRKVDRGVTLTTALLRQRYVTMQSDECVAPNGWLPHTAQTASGRNDKPIEFRGEFKIRAQQQLEDLSAVSLRRWGISSVEPILNQKNSENDWENLQHLVEVDLAGNLLSDWNDVAHLLRALPCMQKLSLASNRLGDILPARENDNNKATDQVDDDDSSNSVLPVTPSMTYLNLRQTNLQSADSLLQIGRAFPNLQELAVSDCPLSNLTRKDASAFAQAFPTLSLLDCSSCGFDSCEPVFAFCKMPCLESLSLDDNRALSDWQGLQPSTDFVKLETLQLSGTSFDDWTTLSKPLQGLARLCRLRLRSCPLLQSMGTGQARIVTIAHFPAIQVLNASRVTEAERKDAARWYVRTIRRHQLEGKMKHENENDPRNSSSREKDKNIDSKKGDELSDNDTLFSYWTKHYPELTQTVDSASGQDATGALIDSVVNVTIRSMAANSCTMDALVRRLPQQLTVGRLKALCARQFGLDIDLQTLHYRQTEQAFPTAMDGNDHTLAYYGVPDGAEILMNELDVEALQREEERVAKELAQRMARQELELDDFQERQKRLGERGMLQK